MNGPGILQFLCNVKNKNNHAFACEYSRFSSLPVARGVELQLFINRDSTVEGIRFNSVLMRT